MADKRKHIRVVGFRAVENYARPKQNMKFPPPPARDRTSHSAHLLGQLQSAKKELDAVTGKRQAEGLPTDVGVTIDVQLLPGFQEVLRTVESKRAKIELLTVYELDGTEHAVISVPDEGIAHFDRLLHEYARSTGTKSGAKLLNAVSDIRVAILQSLWTDLQTPFPPEDIPYRWEVWLRSHKGDVGLVDRFRADAARRGITVGRRELRFLDRVVLVALGKARDLAACATLLGTVAELRQARETASFFRDLPLEDEHGFVASLAGLLVPPGQNAPLICILDSGVNNDHPLLKVALPDARRLTIDKAWGVDDDHRLGHGTGMAGLALLGDLTEALTSTGVVALTHGLESVKIEPGTWNPAARSAKDPEYLHGAATEEAVARAESALPDAVRVFCLPRTTSGSDMGEPSAWSAAVDGLAAGVTDLAGQIVEAGGPRLVLVSAGNISPLEKCAEYPSRNEAELVQSPGQAWNALTVGAYTEKIDIEGPDFDGFTPLAARGDLAPMSPSSVAFRKGWPLKPEVVFEGGNFARDVAGSLRDDVESLWLLTTNRRTLTDRRLLTVFNGTSASVAQASRMAAQLRASYPDYWPETIRALMVHSARWTPEMLKRYLKGKAVSKAPKDALRALRQTCGFGVPDLERALWSSSNALTLVKEDQIQPFEKHGSSNRLREMHLHALPWPEAALRGLAGAEVKLRVTLSYFVEPSPGRRGRYQHRYQSHGLRFDVRGAGQTLQAFRERVNQAAIEEEQGRIDDRYTDSNWILGRQSWRTGSIHSDTWVGTAADLADRGVLAVFPVTGWWKDRKDQRRFDRMARYSLLVSIETPPVDVDIYAEVESLVAASIVV